MSSGGSSYRPPVEAPNTLQSQQVVTILDAISEGPIFGLVTGDERSIALNNTILKTEAGAFTYNNVEWDMVKGYPDQSAMDGVDGIESEIGVGLEVTQFYPRASGTGSGAVSKTINNLNCTHVRVTLGVNGLWKQLLDNEDTAGDTIGNTVSYTITIKDKDNVIHTNYSKSRTDKTRSSAQWSHQFPLEGNGPWTITVIKTYPDNEKNTEQNDLNWSSYTEIIKKNSLIHIRP